MHSATESGWFSQTWSHVLMHATVYSSLAESTRVWYDAVPIPGLVAQERKLTNHVGVNNEHCITGYFVTLYNWLFCYTV